MKIYEYIKGENKRTSKLFGFTIYEQFSDYMTTDREQVFLNGLLKTSKTSENYEYHTEKDVKVLGMSLIKRIEDGNTCTYYLLGIPFRKIQFESLYKKYYLRNVKEKYDDVYILDANSGEIYLFLAYVLETYMKKNGSVNSLLVATKKYHIDLIKTMYPDIPFVFVEKIHRNIKSDTFSSDGTRFFMAFQHSHFKKIDAKLHNNKSGEVHYFDELLSRVNISRNEISMKKVVIPESDENSMLQKVSKTGLNLDNFIFIAPEALSCTAIEKSFWVKLINDYKKLGFDIFVNIVSNSNDLSEAEFKTCMLSYSEAFALAKRAKRIISLRSGFTEYLLQTNTPMDILYTKFSNRHSFDDLSSSDVLSGFTVKKLPFINSENIREFDMEKAKYNEVISVLLPI